MSRSFTWDNPTINAVVKEREFQDQKYGTVQTTGGHELAAWLLIIEAELNEAKKAAIHGGFQSAGGRDDIRSEIVQIAAVCFAALEQHGVTEKPIPIGVPYREVNPL